MRTIVIASKPGYAEWRDHARLCLNDNIAPHDVLWLENEDAPDLLHSLPDVTRPPSAKAAAFKVPKNFLELAEHAICYRSPDRFALLYKVLWRLCHENKNLLHLKTDDDVIQLISYVKAVRRDAYKIKAFLRFREIQNDDGGHFVAWYEPFHYSLNLSLQFFKTRFKNMSWSILTPDGAAHWDKENLSFTETPDRSIYPKDDQVEQY